MHTLLSCLFSTALVVCPLIASAQNTDDQDVIRLYNGQNHDGWYLFVPHEDGADPSTDPRKIFTIDDGILRISGEEFGCLTTTDEYENYRLVFEFKWGTQKWPPRENAKRDSGILMHVVGPDRVWPKSIECQVQEGDCGDFFMIGGTSIVVDGERTSRRVVKSPDAEKPNGEWNVIEVICDGATIINKVNGIEVNRGIDASQSRGKIVIQSEGAELFVRRIDLYPLTDSHD